MSAHVANHTVEEYGADALPQPTRKVCHEWVYPIGSRRLLAKSNRRVKNRSEEHTSELQSLMSISYAVFCLKKKTASECSATQITPSHYRVVTERPTETTLPATNTQRK